MKILRFSLLTSTLALAFLASYIVLWRLTFATVGENDNTIYSMQALSRPAISVTKASSKQMTQTEKPVHYLIFDASEHKGSLDFLDALSAKWQILVVNLISQRQLESCQRCRVVKETWTSSHLANEMASSTWKTMPAYAKEKIVAILYALLNSAEWLYVTDSPFLPKEETLLSVCSHKTRAGPVYRGSRPVFEPCEHFMDPYTWHGLNTPGPQGRYCVVYLFTDAIHMVVDNCYKQHMDPRTWMEGLDTQIPRPYTGAGTFSSVNFRNVLVSRNMTWSLVASLTLTAAKSSPIALQNVLLNLMVQRVVWETNGMIGFLPSLHTPDTPACPSCDVNATVHKIGLQHVKKLSDWRCPSSRNVVECLQELHEKISSHYLLASTTLGPEMKLLLDAWLEVFSSNRFPTPTRIPLNATRLNAKNQGTPASFTAAKSMHVVNRNVSFPSNAFAHLCKAADGKNYTAQIPASHSITDILLVIIFNFPNLVGSIPKLEYLYGRHFKHILYCSENMGPFQKVYADKHPNEPVSYVQVNVHRGWYGDRCMNLAIKSGYQVAGYLQMSDDVILNAWNLHSLPRGVPWFQKSMRVAHIDSKLVPDVWTDGRWGPWISNTGYGRPAALNVFQRLQELRDVPGVGEKVSALLDTIQDVTGCDRCLIYEASDIFYVPAQIAEDFAFFDDIFAPSNIHLEIAIPSILTGLVTDAGIYRLRGSYLWYKDRDRYPKVYTRFVHFHHTFKFGKLEDPVGRRFFCEEVLRWMDADLVAQGNGTESGDTGQLKNNTGKLS